MQRRDAPQSTVRHVQLDDPLLPRELDALVPAPAARGRLHAVVAVRLLPEPLLRPGELLGRVIVVAPIAVAAIGQADERLSVDHERCGELPVEDELEPMREPPASEHALPEAQRWTHDEVAL